MASSPVVSIHWLHEHLGDEDLRIVDASWHMPVSGRDPEAEYAVAHLPGAVFFDLDKHSRPSPLPHMLPDSERFSEVVGRLGISEKHRIVVYDATGLFSAPRVWWMFRYFGAADVRILDGGLPAWQAAGYPVDSREVTPVATRFHAGSPACRVASAEDVLAASESNAALVLDARSRARFLGEEKEVRPGLRSGHIPGSKSMPFTELLDQGHLKSEADLRSVLQARGVSTDTSVITTCGSGVTAAIISLALEIIGVQDVALYDGSWTEWGAREELPVASGSLS